MYPASLLEATLLTLLLLLVALQCSKLVLALVAAAQNALQAHAEDQNPLMPLDAGAPLEQPVQETGVPIHHGLFQARITAGESYLGVRFVPVQETQQACLIEDALQQSVGGLGIAQESLYQRNLPAAMVAGLRKVSGCIDELRITSCWHKFCYFV